ncbi:MAG: methyltransferase domain-containing protein [Candidatus Methylomirabilales bacterium]
MAMIRPLPRKEALELLDLPCLDGAELLEALRDLERINRLFGGTSLILFHLSRLVKACRLSGTISILDVGTGGADIPRAIVRWAERRGLRVKITACDHNEQILEVASAFCSGFPQISLVKEDALKLPYPPEHFDFSISSLTLHHLRAEEAVLLLQKLNELSRLGLIVNDLYRSRLAYLGVFVGTRLFGRNRLIRHDGPLSVLRAFTVAELRTLAEKAGLPDVKLYRHPFFRVAAVREKVRSEK